MRKEFFILMTVVGVCEEIYVLLNPLDNLCLIFPTMEHEKDVCASKIIENRENLTAQYSR